MSGRLTSPEPIKQFLPAAWVAPLLGAALVALAAYLALVTVPAVTSGTVLATGPGTVVVEVWANTPPEVGAEVALTNGSDVRAAGVVTGVRPHEDGALAVTVEAPALDPAAFPKGTTVSGDLGRQRFASVLLGAAR